MSTNLEDLAVTIGLEKVNPHPNPKKDSTKECSNHWTIALISHASKIRQSQIAQSCLTLCNPMDCSLPGSSVHRIFKARILEWVAI